MSALKEERDDAAGDAMDASSAAVDEELLAELENLRKELKLTPETIKDAWENYTEISSNFTLEGRKVYWLACSLVVTCRRPEMYGEKNGVKTHPISMTALLRHTNLSLKHFFHCMKAWVMMSKLSTDYSRDIQKSEENFIVCQNVYKIYVSLFKKIFTMPGLDAIHCRKRSFLTSPVGAFEFTWLLFLLLKGKYLRCGNDHVECLKILQCCCNIAFKNVFMLNQRSILNADFEGLPAGWHLPGYQLPKEAPCVIDKLHESYGSLNLADVKYKQDYKIAPVLDSLVKEERLQSAKQDRSDLFNPEHFEENHAILTRIYDKYILQAWCYDENIFLKETYRQIELQQIKCSNGDMITFTPVNERRPTHSVPDTPLTGRQYMEPADNSPENSTDAQAKLMAMLATRPSGMSDQISELIADCGGENLGEKIVNIKNYCTAKFEAHPAIDDEKLTLGVKLFYYLMEMILLNERKLNKDIAPLLEQRIFAVCVFTCAMQIVIYSMDLPKDYAFPWILDCMCLPAAHLVRIIELVVRCTDQFSRNIIKHLSYVEETLLEKLIWTADSTLWEDIQRSKYVIPKFEEIARPGTTVNVASMPSTSTTRRALFGAGLTQPSHVTFQSPNYSNIMPGQSLLNSNRNQLANQNANGNAPRKNSSLSIIFRKFYVLAGVRMDELCRKLNINDTETRMKIWTMLEHTIRERRNDPNEGEKWLLKNRHLDQLIMCAIYIIFKLSDKKLDFTDIMHAYKCQPQAHSDVYRSVYFDDTHRGDLIKFYNKIYIVHVKPFVPLISPQGTRSNSDSFSLSPLPANRTFVSPRTHITRNVYVNKLESPTSAEFNSSFSYYFNRSDSRDLKNINKAIGLTAKRQLTDNDERDNKRLCNRKMQALIEEREVQNKI